MSLEKLKDFLREYVTGKKTVDMHAQSDLIKLDQKIHSSGV
jgi:hypothetical protein